MKRDQAVIVARCSDCNALVAAEHRAAHARYNCRPGLHQPMRSPNERVWVTVQYADDGRVLRHGEPIGRWKSAPSGDPR